MNVTVMGLGYVGCISAVCLAERGHRVYGVDVNPDKVELTGRGKSPIVEKYVSEVLAEVVAKGRLTATTDAQEAIAQSECTLVCVGTPSRDNGSLDLRYVEHVAGEIGRALRTSAGRHVVAVRSTMLPGSLESDVVPAIEQHSGKRAGEGFEVCLYPEFLREGSAVEDYYHPPFTLVGTADGQPLPCLEPLYADIDAPVYHLTTRAAAMVKYVSNAFHALKVSFANEIGQICKALDVDSLKVMEVFVRDTQLNISPKYLQPGFAFGGSCLPKDVRALVHRARTLDLDLPVLRSILPSNRQHLDRAFSLIQRTGLKRVGLVGLSFKAGTDDLRESPLVTLVEQMIGKGFDLRVYDEHVMLARLTGANKQYIEHVIPHVSSLLVRDLDALLEHAEVVVIGRNGPEARAVMSRLNGTHMVVDLARVDRDLPQREPGRYQGLCW